MKHLRGMCLSGLVLLAAGTYSGAQLSVRQISVISENPFQLEIQTSAAVTPQTQIVSGPERLVIDIPNAVPGSGLRGIAIHRGEVKGVRVGLFSAAPPVTRIVVDLNQPQWYRILPVPSGLRVSLGADGESSTKAPATIGWVSTKVSSKSASSRGTPLLVKKSAAKQQRPEKTISVQFASGRLTIHAHGATLSEVLYAVQKETGAEIAVPSGTEQDRVAADFGPGPASKVLSELLNGSGLNFVVVGSESDPNVLRSVILSRKSDAPEPPPALAQSYSPVPPVAENTEEEQIPPPPPPDENSTQPQQAPANGPPPDAPPG